jgi:two-component system chemotaxis response regulator CheY
VSHEKILVVEDEDSLSRLLTAVLEFKGYQDVETASNGQEGIKKYKENRPDLVLMDLEMPVMNGYESSKEIRKYDPEANIVLITGNPLSPLVQRTIQEGYASHIIPKPFDLNQILQTVTSTLSPHPSSRYSH